jgi:hypothetical protein
MTSKTIAARLAALEALERGRPAGPTFACIHPLDWEAYDDLSTPADVRQAIADAYQLDAGQKLYVGCCLCDPPEACRVCGDEPVIMTKEL